MRMYELHKVVDEATGRHEPIRIGYGTPVPVAIVSEESVEDVFTKGELAGARPIIRHEDGRIQVGHYVYVPVKGESA